MTLRLIVGPPNSGRTGAVMSALERSLAGGGGGLAGAAVGGPILVVPTSQDVARVERELTARGLALGVATTTFAGLFAEAARAAGVDAPPAASGVQRRELVRRAIAATPLRLLAGSAARTGFHAALERLLGELAAAGTSATQVRSRATDSELPALLEELASLQEAYAGGLAAAGLAGEHELALRATRELAREPSTWGGREVLLLGFDDLAPLQLSLLEAIAKDANVTVSVTYEDRDAAAARARLPAELEERGAEVVLRLEPNPRHTSSAALHRLERGFLRPGAETGPADAGVGVMIAAGERGAAEQVGAEVARLIAAGEDPSEIAIVLRDPGPQALLWESVLAGFGVPASIEASIALTATATGRGLRGLLRAWGPEGAATDLLAFLRAPGSAYARHVDRFERHLRREGIADAGPAREAWDGRRLFELEDLDGAGDGAELLTALARAARKLAERPHHRSAPTSGRHLELELRAADAAAKSLEQLAVLMTARPAAEAAQAALLELEAAELELQPGGGGRVRVTNPYRVRARRVRTLFVCSLQEGDFPRPERADPLLSDDAAQLLGLAPRAEALAEERYLFWSCLSRPTERLRLCWRSCDDEGREERPSPFVADALSLLEAGAGPDRLLAEHRHLADVVLPPHAAPSDTELARALASQGEGTLDGLRPGVAERLARARAVVAAGEPEDAKQPAVVAELGRRELFGASTLEEYATCSFRWFVSHELAPRDLEPEPEALAQGSLIHAVLERLYGEPPHPAGIPRPETIEAWAAEARRLSAELAPELGLGGGSSRARVGRARVDALLRGFLEREAASSARLRPDPKLLEASFGDREDDQRPALELGGLRLHGKIDRIDVDPAGRAGLVRDYKLSARVTARRKLEEQGKLQLQLYTLALQRLWGLQPLGGVYEPLGATGDRRGRGLLAGDEVEAALAGLDCVAQDCVDAGELEAMLEAADREASRIAAQMRSGRVTRDPRDDECPSYCTYAGICRRQRAARVELEERELERNGEGE